MRTAKLCGDILWRYVTDDRNISSEQVVIYGESLGGAIALD
ncbi:MAG: hypothetical protein AAGA75_08605 [Cyanobacteria bacterium P01_E01_bin.6]